MIRRKRLNKSKAGTVDYKDYRISDAEILREKLKAHFDPAADREFFMSGTLMTPPREDRHVHH